MTRFAGFCCVVMCYATGCALRPAERGTSAEGLGDPCDQEHALHLTLERPEQPPADLTNDALLRLPGAIVVAEGRHRGEPSMPLRALTGDAAGIEVHACNGAVFRKSSEELGSGGHDAFVFVRNQSGALKLLDMDPSLPGGPKTVLKEVARVRVLD